MPPSSTPGDAAAAADDNRDSSSPPHSRFTVGSVGSWSSDPPPVGLAVPAEASAADNAGDSTAASLSQLSLSRVGESSTPPRAPPATLPASPPSAAKLRPPTAAAENMKSIKIKLTIGDDRPLKDVFFDGAFRDSQVLTFKSTREGAPFELALPLAAVSR